MRACYPAGKQQGRGQMNDDERQLWRVGDLECVMISCCAVRGAATTTGPAQAGRDRRREIVLREMYPMKSDLYDVPAI